jgi:hypothetical protein
MKKQIIQSNLMFTLLCGLFMVGFFTLSPPMVGQAKDPQPQKPGFTILKPVPTEEAATDSVQEDTSNEVPAVPSPNDGGGLVVDMDWLVNKENLIASLLMLVLTWLSGFLPFLSKITDTGKRALVVGLTVIAGFVVAKFIGPGDVSIADFASLSLTYLLTSLGYDKALKPAGLRTPKVAAKA